MNTQPLDLTLLPAGGLLVGDTVLLGDALAVVDLVSRQRGHVTVNFRNGESRGYFGAYVYGALQPVRRVVR